MLQMDVVPMKARMKAVLTSTWFPRRKEVVLRGKEGSIAGEKSLLEMAVSVFQSYKIAHLSSEHAA